MLTCNDGRPSALNAEMCKRRDTVARAIYKLLGARAVDTRFDKRELVYRGTIDHQDLAR